MLKRHQLILFLIKPEPMLSETFQRYFLRKISLCHPLQQQSLVFSFRLWLVWVTIIIEDPFFYHHIILLLGRNRLRFGRSALILQINLCWNIVQAFELLTVSTYIVTLGQ
jgi:hypothetical protein